MPDPQEPLFIQLKEFFDSYDRPDLPGGFLIAVLKEGKLLFKQGYGLANAEHQIRLTPSSVLDFASAAKQFAGFAIATLIEQGKLSLEDEVRQILPELPDFGEKITIAHLLYHTSGIRDWVGLAKVFGRDEGDVISNDFLMKLILKQKELNFKPGESFQYSNSGYFLLAHVVARLSGKSFAAWTKEHIFQPLGMENSFFCDNYQVLIPNRASSYKQNDCGQYAAVYDQLESPGSSSLYSTLDDMIKWMSNYETHALGGDKIWEMMTQSGRLNNGEVVNYGFGVSLNLNQNPINLGHGGSWAGYLCQLTYYPEHKISTILAINRDPAGFQIDQTRLFNILLGKNEPPQIQQQELTKPAEIQISPEEFKQYSGPYLSSRGGILWVESHCEQLMVRFSSGLRVFPFLEKKDQFYTKAFDVRFFFLRDSNNNVNQLVYNVSGNQSQPLKKLNDLASSFQDVEKICGEYTCHELKTSYLIKIKNDRLILEHLHNEDVVLQEIGRDNFRGNVWWCTEIKLTRDSNQKVDGFLLTGDSNNIQNLRFFKTRY